MTPLDPRNGWLGWWPDHGVRAILDPENGRLRKFLEEEARQLADGARVLDASAGTRPYAGIFHRQIYESCDVPDGFYPCKHDFECYLESIPRPDATYDAVILTQVLEHAPNPETALRELNRVLKPGCLLLVTVPLNAPLHGAAGQAGCRPAAAVDETSGPVPGQKTRPVRDWMPRRHDSAAAALAGVCAPSRLRGASALLLA